MSTLSSQLRQALTESPREQATIARACGMTPSTLCRFLLGKGGISLAAADRLAAYLGLMLKPLSKTDGGQA